MSKKIVLGVTGKKLTYHQKDLIWFYYGVDNCERCGIFLFDKPKRFSHIHHIDHDGTNQDPSNFEFLCMPCHQKHHKTGNMNNRKFDVGEESEICEAYATGLFNMKELANGADCEAQAISGILNRWDPKEVKNISGKLKSANLAKRHADGIMSLGKVDNVKTRKVGR